MLKFPVKDQFRTLRLNVIHKPMIRGVWKVNCVLYLRLSGHRTIAMLLGARSFSLIVNIIGRRSSSNIKELIMAFMLYSEKILKILFQSLRF